MLGKMLNLSGNTCLENWKLNLHLRWLNWIIHVYTSGIPICWTLIFWSLLITWTISHFPQSSTLTIPPCQFGIYMYVAEKGCQNKLDGFWIAKISRQLLNHLKHLVKINRFKKPKDWPPKEQLKEFWVHRVQSELEKVPICVCWTRVTEVGLSLRGQWTQALNEWECRLCGKPHAKTWLATT